MASEDWLGALSKRPPVDPLAGTNIVLFGYADGMKFTGAVVFRDDSGEHARVVVGADGPCLVMQGRTYSLPASMPFSAPYSAHERIF